MKIKAYAYEADVHCVECAMKRFAKPRHMYNELDENSIPMEQEDNEGNKITPIFSTDECPLTHCGDCHQEL